MTDLDPPADLEPAELPPYIIEAARSGRAKCKACRKAIAKEALRLGVLVEGPFGAGHMWYHIPCAARRLFDKLSEAYRLEAWTLAKVPLKAEDMPPLEELAELKQEAEKKKAQQKELPHTEPAPSGRARCKFCDGLIEKGTPRVVIGRSVEFGQQVRTAPINVHPGCVAQALRAEDCATPAEGFFEALRSNSRGVDEAVIEAAVTEIGSLF